MLRRHWTLSSYEPHILHISHASVFWTDITAATLSITLIPGIPRQPNCQTFQFSAKTIHWPRGSTWPHRHSNSPHFFTQPSNNSPTISSRATVSYGASRDGRTMTLLAGSYSEARARYTSPARRDKQTDPPYKVKSREYCHRRGAGWYCGALFLSAKPKLRHHGRVLGVGRYPMTGSLLYWQVLTIINVLIFESL